MGNSKMSMNRSGDEGADGNGWCNVEKKNKFGANRAKTF